MSSNNIALNMDKQSLIALLQSKLSEIVVDEEDEAQMSDEEVRLFRAYSLINIALDEELWESMDEVARQPVVDLATEIVTNHMKLHSNQ